MPAGDGATIDVKSPSCHSCGAPLKGPFRVTVDDLYSFACPGCEDQQRATALVGQIVYCLPQADDEHA